MEKLRTPDLAQTIRLELGSKFLVEHPGSLAETCAQAEVYLIELMTEAVVRELGLEAVARGLTFKSIEPKRFLLNNEIYTIKVTEYVANDSVLAGRIKWTTSSRGQTHSSSASTTTR